MDYSAEILIANSNFLDYPYSKMAKSRNRNSTLVASLCRVWSVSKNNSESARKFVKNLYQHRLYINFILLISQVSYRNLILRA